ncbi:hypothetical protein BDFB_014917 [Asbolus verrucosus]|uniref:Uncharacterized protein n=1 Tax=Asbolus verrucosus TaxID=1661398 RepID=A0A482VRS6_ASBVE|nr:hypothetical protein BDFB_014917 [Asbolus verrucosus]
MGSEFTQHEMHLKISGKLLRT